MAASPVAQAADNNRGQMWNQGTVEFIADFMRRLKPGNPMLPYAEDIVRVSYQHNINPIFTVAMAHAETELGTTGTGRAPTYNPFGFKGYTFPSYKQAIERFGSTIAGPLYYGEGRFSAEKISEKYAPLSDSPLNKNHLPNLRAAMKLAGGYTGADVRVDKTKSLTGAAGDGAGEVVGAVADATGLGAIVGLLKFLADPALWLRIGNMIVGVIGMVVGVLFALRGGGNASRPIGLLLVLFGFGWLWSGVKDVNPITTLKEVIGVGTT